MPSKYPGSPEQVRALSAVISLLRCVSRELLPRGIRVNAVAHGPIDIPIHGKLGMPSEAIAQAVEFLATSASSFIARIEISVDGGITEL